MSEEVTTPWTRFARVALNGHQDLGTCLVVFDTTLGLFRAECLTEEPSRAVHFPRGSVYRIDEVTEAEAQTEIAAAAAKRTLKAARAEAARVASEQRLADIRANGGAITASFGENDFAIRWTSDLDAEVMRSALRTRLVGHRSQFPLLRLGAGELESDWRWSNADRALVAQFVRDVGGEVHGEVGEPEPHDHDEDDDIPL